MATLSRRSYASADTSSATHSSRVKSTRHGLFLNHRRSGSDHTSSCPACLWCSGLRVCVCVCVWMCTGEQRTAKDVPLLTTIHIILLPVFGCSESCLHDKFLEMAGTTRRLVVELRGGTLHQRHSSTNHFVVFQDTRRQHVRVG